VNLGLVHAQRITTEITTDTDDVFADMSELSRHKKYASTPEIPISQYEPQRDPWAIRRPLPLRLIPRVLRTFQGRRLCIYEALA